MSTSRFERWRLGLQQASFRGVPFFVESTTYSGGRRAIIRQYPQRDLPSSEDNGREARKYPINAFFVGPDFIADHQKLIAALETAGPGTLVHPFYGTVRVVIDGEFSVSINGQPVGVASITIPFIEAGEEAAPKASADSLLKTLGGADKVVSAVKGWFAKTFNIEGMGDWYKTSAISQVTGVVDMVRDTLKTVVPGIDAIHDDIIDNLHDLLDNPSELGAAISDMIGSVKNVIDLPGRASDMVAGVLESVGGGRKKTSTSTVIKPDPAVVARKLVTLAADARRQASTVQAASALPQRVQEAANAKAVLALVEDVALADAAGVSTTLPATVYDDICDVRDSITAALDDAAQSAPVETFEPLNALRVDVYADMTERASDSARIREMTLASVMPAVVLAYDLYLDAGRYEEIAERNKILNPAFLPDKTIKVLTA